MFRVLNSYKQVILMASLFQVCLAKRPFKVFHHANLSIRTASVNRTFSDKATLEHSSPQLFGRYVIEYNRAILPNGQGNIVVGGQDALCSLNGVNFIHYHSLITLLQCLKALTI